MLKESKRVKTIVKEPKDELNNYIPNTSCGPFLIGDNILNYLHLQHTKIHCSMEKYGLPDYDFYYFKDFGIRIYTEEYDVNKICTIFCDEACYWEGRNIIGMLISVFIKTYNLHPVLDDGELTFVLDEKHRYTQRIYEFEDNIGLTIWTWRKRIVTVAICNNNDM